MPEPTLTRQDIRATHRLITPAECKHGPATVYCAICDGSLGVCIRCRAAECELTEQTCAERLVGRYVRLDDGARGEVVTASPDGRAVRVRAMNGTERRVAVDKIVKVEAQR